MNRLITNIKLSFSTNACIIPEVVYNYCEEINDIYTQCAGEIDFALYALAYDSKKEYQREIEDIVDRLTRVVKHTYILQETMRLYRPTKSQKLFLHGYHDTLEQRRVQASQLIRSYSVLGGLSNDPEYQHIIHIGKTIMQHITTFYIFSEVRCKTK